MPVTLVSAETIEISREDLLGLFAVAEGVTDVLRYLNDFDPDEASNEIWGLFSRLFPIEPDHDGNDASNLEEVLVTARASEIEAALLERYAEQNVPAWCTKARERAAICRAVAPRYREKGSVNVMFQLDDAPACGRDDA